MRMIGWTSEGGSTVVVSCTTDETSPEMFPEAMYWFERDHGAQVDPKVNFQKKKKKKKTYGYHRSFYQKQGGECT